MRVRRKNNSSGLLFLVITLLIATVFWFGSWAGSIAAPQAYYYIIAEGLPPVLLDPPPMEKSSEWKKQTDAVVALQKTVSKQDLLAIKNEQHMRVELMTSMLGPDFTRDKYPKTFQLLDHVFADTEEVTTIDKVFWHTKRPYLVNHSVKLLVDPIDQNPSYPSGHTSTSNVLAEVLGMLYPARRAEFRARAEAISMHRIEAGVHYPVDIEGGRALAKLMVGALSQSDDFDDDLTAARNEIAAAH